MGAATDLASEGLRRWWSTAVFWGLGLDVPAKADVQHRGLDDAALMYGFNGFRKGVKPSAHALDVVEPYPPANRSAKPRFENFNLSRPGEVHPLKSLRCLAKIPPKPDVDLGIVPTHLSASSAPRFRMKTDAFPAIRMAGCWSSPGSGNWRKSPPVKFTCVQVSIFPGTAPEEHRRTARGLKALDLEVDFVLMVGGVNPMNPADEDAVVAQLLPSLKAAVAHGTRHVSSTSIEESDERQPKPAAKARTSRRPSPRT